MRALILPYFSIALVSCVTIAPASGQIYFGEDRGPGDDGVRLGQYPNANAAAQAFLSALGTSAIEDLESFPPGQVAPIGIFEGSGSEAELSGPGYVIEVPSGTYAGAFPISGDQFWFVAYPPVPHAVTFAGPQSAFGFYATDVGDFGGQIVLTFDDAWQETVPSIIGAPSGGVLFFGIISSERPFTSVSFTHTVNYDGVGYDNFILGSLPPPLGACCQLDGTCITTDEASCEDPNMWKGVGTTCTPNPCDPLGACCTADGACSIGTEADCQPEGIWQGQGVLCDATPCQTGACCLNAYCARLAEDECLFYGGTYEGNGTPCEPNPCPTSSADAGPQLATPTLEVVPNPSAGEVTIRYWLPKASDVTVEILDASGRLVRRQFEGLRSPGSQAVTWGCRDGKGRRLASGLYLVRLLTTEGRATSRVVVAQ